MRQTIAIALLLLAACKTPATKASKARDALASWASAGRMLSRGWARGDTQTPYVKSTARVASNEIDQLKQDLQTDKESMHALGEVAALYQKLSDAIEQDDRASAEQLARAFANVSAQLQQQKSS